MNGIFAGYVLLKIGQREMCVSLLRIHLLRNSCKLTFSKTQLYLGRQ